MAAAFSFWSGNIRGGRASVEQDGINAWPSRARSYCDLLRNRSPDLVGLQEFDSNNLEAFSAALPGWSYNSGAELGKGTYTPTFHREARFKARAQGGMWLNRDPARKAPDWDSDTERGMTWNELEDAAAGRSVLFLNLHLDHKGEIARQRSARMILDFVERWPEDQPTLITGDFNCSPYRPIKRTQYTPRTFGMFAEAGFMDLYRSLTGVWPPPATFHNYQGAAYRPDQYGTWYIDWPLARNLKPLDVEIVRFASGEQAHSDHYPLWGRVEYTARD